VNPGNSGYAEAFPNLVIRGNTVLNFGRVGIGVAACDPCTIENNVIVMGADLTSRAIRAPVMRPDDSNDMVMSNVTIRNNSLYVSEGAGTAIELGTEGSGHVVVSNSVHYGGVESDWSCLKLDRPASAYQTVSNNLCHRPNSSSSEWVAGVGTLSEWQTSSGHGAGSVQSDPLYGSLNRTAPDLAVGAGSPLIGAGHPTASTLTDLSGSARDEHPDIGAYEYAP